jgi:hypothetical protein
MCEYSIEGHVKTRDAEVGDKLVTTDFGYGTRGFSASRNRKVAVCLKPGTELVFAKNVKVIQPWKGSFKHLLKAVFRLDYEVVEGTTAIFKQMQMGAHRDSLEFPNGLTVLLTKLMTGQRATVLQLPFKETTKIVEEIHVGGGCSIVTAPELETIS